MRAFWVLVYLVIVIGTIVGSIYLVLFMWPLMVVIIAICFVINAAMTWYQKKTQ